MYGISQAMSYLLDNWGSFVSLLGLVATVIGLIVVFRRAGEARKSAADARIAALETQRSITNMLMIVDLQRAIAMVQRLKQLHIDRKWEVSLELYQPLRVMLTNINTRSTIAKPEFREAIEQIRIMENTIKNALTQEGELIETNYSFGTLNDIQVSLEALASSAPMPESGAD